MSADSPRRTCGSATRGVLTVPATVPPQVVSDRSILDSAIGFINEVTLAHPPSIDPKDTITWARFETSADISDPRFGEDWELEGNVAPPLLLILGYGSGVQVWAIPANGEAVEVLSWRHGIVSALKVLPTPLSAVANEENGRADEPTDAFADKRPLIALVDGSSTSATQPQFCAVNFISLKTGTQVKTIKFKNPVIDILANRSSVVITFHERVAVFDAYTLEDRLSITTCYPSPGINPNPVALGPRWLAYAENKLLHSKTSGGGCDGDGVASYTATVLNASKSLVKGLRELGEQVAAGLTGTAGNTGNSKNASFDSGCGHDTKQPGVVTIIDIKNPIRDYSPTSSVPMSSTPIAGTDAIIAHFVAHSEALVAMEFDNSGMLLVTADRRGHDFHVFRIQPNPVGSSLAAIHHLYILHRGDTTAKVQNVALTLDSRWVAVSTLRGTTHVFPITPYGGAMGVRTHASLHVVNKLSRFHRSAGLSGEGRSNSPICHSESTTFAQSLQPYHNTTLPPFPRPTVVTPLAQLRQPFTLGSPPGSASLAAVKSVSGGSGGSGTQRQRLSSLSDDNGKPLSVCAIFAKSRSWLLDPPNVTREAPHRMQRKAVDSLFVMAGHGALIQYDLGTKLASNVAKEKICDDTPIELEVEAKAQWNLGRHKEGSQEIMPPLSSDNWLIKNRNSCMLSDSSRQYDDSDERGDSWLAQVEIITHAGPHRRLWMGPQFVFKTYNTPSGSNLNHVDTEAVEIGTVKPASTVASEKMGHSSPLNMPITTAGRSSAVPVLIESGSYSSIEQSPKLMDRFRHDHLDSDYCVTHGDTRLKEDLADAMRESPSTAGTSKDAGGHGHVCESGGSSDNVAFYDALTAEEDQVYIRARSASAAALASVLPNIHSYDNNESYELLDSAKKPKPSIEKIVNPLGTVTTVTSCLTADIKTDILDEVVSQLAAEDSIIHENCDESLFRPFVAIFCDEKTQRQNEEEARRNSEEYQSPEIISNKLVVPVIAKEVNDELSKREKEKISAIKSNPVIIKTKPKEQTNREKLPLLDKKAKESKKTSNSKGNLRLDVQSEGNNILKNTSSVTKCGKQVDALTDPIYEQEELGCSKDTLPLKEASGEVNMTQTMNPKDLLMVKHLRDVETYACGAQKEMPTQEFKRKTKKELNSSNEEVIENVAVIETKYKSKILSCNENNKDKGPWSTTKITKQNAAEKCVDELRTDFNLNISSCKVDRKDGTKTKIDIENGSNKSELNFMHTTHTAMQEEVKPTKDSIKNSKSHTNDFVTTSELNFEQSTDDLVEKEQCEEKVEVKESEKCKITGKEKECEDCDLAVNPFLCKKKDSARLKSTCENVDKVGAASEASDNNVCVGLKKNCRSRETLHLQGELKIGETDALISREVDVAMSTKPIKESKAGFEIAKPQTTRKGQPNKNKSDGKLITKSKSNEQVNSDFVNQTSEVCEEKLKAYDSGSVDKTNKMLNQNKKNGTESYEIEELITEERAASQFDCDPIKMKSYSSIELKTKTIKTQEIEISNRNLPKNQSSSIKEIEKPKIARNETKSEECVLTANPFLCEKEVSVESKSTCENVFGCMSATKCKSEFDKIDSINVFDEPKTSESSASKKEQKRYITDKRSNEVSDKNVFVGLEKSSKNKDTHLLRSEQKISDTNVSINREVNVPMNVKPMKESKASFEIPKSQTNRRGQPNKNKSDGKMITKSKSNEHGNSDSVKQSTEVCEKNVTAHNSGLVDKTKKIFNQNKRNGTENYEIENVIRSEESVKSQIKSVFAKKNSREFIASENKEDLDLSQKNSWDLTTCDKGNVEKKENLLKTAIVREVEMKSKNFPNEEELLENTSCTYRKGKVFIKQLPIPTPPPPSAWKILSGAEVINKNLTTDIEFPSLGPISNQIKLLPEFPTPADIGKHSVLDEFSILKSLDPLPPLPALEPLQLMTENKSISSKDISLMTFESPSVESPLPQRKITPAPRGFTDQNLILALCGSLRYDNDPTENIELSPPNQSSITFEDTSQADYKWVTDNDDPYVSLEQSSQDTNTATTNTTNEKFSSSSNSSGSEEIIIIEENKMSKKQKRKKQQQQLKEFQKQTQPHEVEDEELRPLIAMTDSQVYQAKKFLNETLPAAVGNSDMYQPLSTQPLIHSTTTDSEGPLPATTSDENVFAIPVPVVHNPHKIKTKKLEHKINLIAAIEAATSSSTSSAEESGVELGGRSSHDNGQSLISVANSISNSVIPLPIVATSQTTVGALKKKTKRHLEFHNVANGDSAKDTKRNIVNKSSSSTTSKCETSRKVKNMKNKNYQDTNSTRMTPVSQHHTTELYKSRCQNAIRPYNKQHQRQNHQASNAVENCYSNDCASTIINIDLFDDQLSTSSNSNTSHFSCEAVPTSTTTPPISLNGVFDTNLMHFPVNSTDLLNTDRIHYGCSRLSEDLATSDQKYDITTGVTKNDNDDYDNSSNGSGGSL